MSCICDVCGKETPSLIMGGRVFGGSKGRCQSCFDKKEHGEEKSCSNCIHQCMDMDMDPYCAAVNKPFGQTLTQPRPKLCAGASGTVYLLWEKDTRREPTFCKLCGKSKLSFQVFCGAACTAKWEAGERPKASP